MSLVMPQSLSTSPRFDTGLSILETELRAEQAFALGRLGRELETSLAALAATVTNAPGRYDLVRAAAEAVWRFFVQRECCGLYDQQAVVTHYRIPPHVLAQVGGR